MIIEKEEFKLFKDQKVLKSLYAHQKFILNYNKDDPVKIHVPTSGGKTLSAVLFALRNRQGTTLRLAACPWLKSSGKYCGRSPSQARGISRCHENWTVDFWNKRGRTKGDGIPRQRRAARCAFQNASGGRGRRRLRWRELPRPARWGWPRPPRARGLPSLNSFRPGCSRS